jgi:hypothetical protein
MIVESIYVASLCRVMTGRLSDLATPFSPLVGERVASAHGSSAIWSCGAHCWWNRPDWIIHRVAGWLSTVAWMLLS